MIGYCLIKVWCTFCLQSDEELDFSEDSSEEDEDEDDEKGDDVDASQQRTPGGGKVNIYFKIKLPASKHKRVSSPLQG